MQALVHSVPQPCSRPAPTHTSTGDSWTLMGKSGSVSCGVTAPFSCVLMHTRFFLCFPRVCFPVLCKFWWLYGGLMATTSKELMPWPGLLHPEPLPPQQSTADPHLPRRHPNTVLPQSLWGLWVLVCTRFVWALWASLAGMEFDSKCDLTPPTILLGLLLCPWTWSISFKSLQPPTAAAQAPWSCSSSCRAAPWTIQSVEFSRPEYWSG